METKIYYAPETFVEILNAIPKAPKAPKPFGEIHFAMGNKGWWALDPKKESGFHYETLQEAVAAWDVTVEYAVMALDGVRYVAKPN